MKKSILLITALAHSSVSFAQKKELKDVKKAIDRNNLTEAEQLLEKSKDLAFSSKKTTAEYYLLRGELALKNVKAGKDVVNSLAIASSSLTEAKKVGGKISSEVEQIAREVASIAAAKGQQFYEKNDFKNAAIAFEQVYRFSPSDTLFLYNAAVASTQAKDYEPALKYFLELKDLKYDGSETLYAAKNK